MFFRSKVAALELGFAIAALCATPASAQITTQEVPQHSWSLTITQPDDTIKAYVNGILVSTCTFGSTCNVNLSDYLVSGKNKVKLTLDNTDAGWTYNYTFYEDGNAVMGASCGSFNETGCMGDENTKGNVYGVTVTITN
jgi:hypothetical protein